MISLRRDGTIAHHSGLVVGSWTRTVEGRWQAWGGRHHLDLVADCATRAELVRWVEAHAVDEWGMVAPLAA